MSVNTRLISLITSFVFVLVSGIALAAPPPGKGKPGDGGGGSGLTTISNNNWGETPVRKILQTFAFGGLATDAQIATWAGMSPEAAIQEILTFEPVNSKLSPPEAGDDNELHCGSLADIQEFWSGDSAGNVMKYTDRYRIRSYYDDVIAELTASGNFVNVMTTAARQNLYPAGYA